MNNTASQPGFYPNLAIGGLAAAISQTIFYPVDRAHLLMANNQSLPKEGFFAKWKGNTQAILSFTPKQALNFAFYNFYKYVFCNERIETSYPKYIFTHLFSGALAGFTSLVFTYPSDYARSVFLANRQSAEPIKYSTMLDCITHIKRTQGVSKFYTGFGFSVFDIMLYRAIYFGGYDTTKRLISEFAGENLNIFYRIFAAFSVIAFSAVLTSPIAVVKRKLLLQPNQSQFTGFIDCFSKTYKAEGFSSFFKGVGRSIYLGKTSAACLVLFDELQMWSSVLLNRF